MIRLLLIIDHLRGGGTEQQALVLARQWLAAGGAVDLLVFLPGGRLWSSIPDHPDCSVHILQYWLLATPTDAQGHKISRSRLELPNASLSRRMLEKVHLPLWAPGLRKTLVGLEPDIAVLMGRTANCYGKYIRECLETVPVIATVRTGKRLLPWHEETLRCADGIWTNCHWWAVRLQNLSIPAQRIRVIHNAVRAAIAQRPRDTDLVEVPVFINVAGFRRGKRQDLLLRSWALVREQLGKNDIMPKLILVGEGPRSGYCRRLSEQLGLTDCIQFVGWQSNLDNYYRSGNVAVSMSQEDALPNFLVEAQWCGMPVIAADCAGVRECFAPGISGFLIASEDCKAMAGHVLRFMNDRTLLREGSRHAAAFARLHFDPEIQSRRTLEMLHQWNAL